MLNVHTRTCYDAVVSAHFNERTSATQHMQVAKKGDTLLFDRGYFSRALVEEAGQRGLNVVFRLKNDAFKAAKVFYNSCRTSAKVRMTTATGQRDVYLLKYFIDGKRYMCLTNFPCTTSEVKRLYALRWRVETSFKRLKTDLNLRTSHSMTREGFVQELEARLLYDTLTIMSLPSEDPQSNPKGGSIRPRLTYLQGLDEMLDIIYIAKVCREVRLDNVSFLKVLVRRKDPHVIRKI